METVGQTVELDARALRLKSMRRGVLTAARLHVESVPKWRGAMVTLTYRPGLEWRSSDVRGYLERCRKFVQSHKHTFRYTWVAELQARGAVHYHVLVWLPQGLVLPKADVSGWWPHGMSRMEWSRAPIRYLMKYGTKLSSKGGTLPRGLRLHGAGGLSRADRGVRRWWVAPSWVRQRFPGEQLVRRVGSAAGAACGWLAEGTGEFCASPWLFLGLRQGSPVLMWRGFSDA